MKLIPLPSETTLLTGFTHKVTLTYADITAAAGASDTSVTIQIVPDVAGSTVPAGTVVRTAAMRLVTAFDASDAAINSLLIEVGDGGDTNRYLASTELAVDGTEIIYFATAPSTMPYAYLAADGIDALFTVAGGATPLLDELTAGEVEIYLGLYNLSDLGTVKQP